MSNGNIHNKFLWGLKEVGLYLSKMRSKNAYIGAMNFNEIKEFKHNSMAIIIIHYFLLVPKILTESIFKKSRYIKNHYKYKI